MARSAVVCDADVLSLDHFPIPFATVGADGAIHAANRLFHLMLSCGWCSESAPLTRSGSSE